MVDFAKSLTFLTEDERWMEKLGIGTVVLLVSTFLSFVLIGLVGFCMVMGYCIRLLQNVRDGNPRPLPEWDRWGDDLLRGFKLLVVTIIWALPLIVFSIPLAIGSAIADSGGDAASFLGAMIILCAGCLMGLYGLLLAVAMPGYAIAFARDEQITSGVQFRQVIEWTRQNLGQTVIVAVVFLVASFVFNLIAGIAGLLLCLIGIIVTIPLGTLVTYLFQYHLYGQLAQAFPMNGSSAIPIAESS